MEKECIQFLARLVEAPSPAGFEQAAQSLVMTRMKKFADEVRTDVHGNVIGVRNPEGKPRVMLAGHCDEIGLMVKHITDEGYIYFEAIGGVGPHRLEGQRVKIHTEKGSVLGVIGRKSRDLIEKEEQEVKLHNLWIDIGAKNKKDAQRSVSIGDPITLAVGFERLKNDLVTSRGFDDKMGVFAVIETMRLISRQKIKAAVFGVSTVQEEVGSRGAWTSAFGIDPDVGIAIDVGAASDYPDIDKRRVGEVSLGKGPMLYKGANINPVLGKMLMQVAEKNRIPYQLCGAARATSTDASVIQITRSGVAAALVSVPNRYMHFPVEVISLKDLENTSKLLACFLRKLTPNVNFRPTRS